MNFKAQVRVQHSLSVRNHYFGVTASLDTGTPLKQPRGLGAQESLGFQNVG